MVGFMMSLSVTLWMVAAALGGGLTILKSLGLLSGLRQGERLVISFVLGIGIIGWLAFFAGLAGLFSGPAFAVMLSALCLGIVFLKAPSESTPAGRLNAIEWLLLGAIILSAGMDFAEALAPAADADSMAYHFETPRLFLEHHAIFAIPRAIDGITQLLLQMTYGVALALGGKAAVPFWTMISGWGLGALFYVLARRHVTRPWALAGTLVMMTSPAIIYAAGTGQVEVRIAAFALLSAYGAALGIKHADEPTLSRGWIILAGLAGGFFAGSKLTGLVFLTAVCVVLIGRQQTIQRMMLFSAAAFIAGGQWYLFNGWHTGDPLYPMLWQVLDLKPGFEWNREMADSLATMWPSAEVIPRSLGWLFAYPFRTIIAPLPEFESLRIGLGPAAIIFLPFAGVATFRTGFRSTSPLFRTLLAALIFYAIWFFTSPSLQIRHLIAVYPLVMLCLLSGIAGFAHLYGQTRTVLCAGVAMMIAVQLSGQAVFSKKYADYIFKEHNEETFLSHNISGYSVVSWINRHLTADDRVLVTNRDWLYLLDVPHFLAHPLLQRNIDIRPENTDVTLFRRQLAKEHITHVVIPGKTLAPDSKDRLGQFMYQLEQRGCANMLIKIDVKTLGSRTLPDMYAVAKDFVIFKLSADPC